MPDILGSIPSTEKKNYKKAKAIVIQLLKSICFLMFFTAKCLAPHRSLEILYIEILVERETRSVDSRPSPLS